MIDECFAGRLSRAVVERLIEDIKISLKISRSLDKIDQRIESPPASITLLKRMQETRMLQEACLQGFKDGVRWMIKNKNRIENVR